MSYHGSSISFLFHRRDAQDDHLEASQQRASGKSKAPPGTIANSQSDFRNFHVRDPKTKQPTPPRKDELFRGYAKTITDPVTAEQKNIELIKKVAAAINSNNPSDKEAENPRIPAGYTYFAQFLTHDIVHNVTPLPTTSGNQGYEPNLRSVPLILGTLYGGGPGIHPHCYETWYDRARDDGRGRLRLGKVGELDDLSIYQDLPRDKSLAKMDCEATGNKCPAGMPDVLIADVRNDDTPILAQIQVLFHLLHNKIHDKILKTRGTSDFSLSSKICAYVYRNIIKEDFLNNRILQEDINNHYKKIRRTEEFIDNTRDAKITREFSHSAFRFGHVMVRNTYEFNDLNKLTNQPFILKIIRQFTSFISIHMPLPCRWVISWDNFFDISRSVESQKSRKLQPSAAFSLAKLKFEDANGESFVNLIEKDLLRGLFAEQWSVEPLLSRVRDLLPKEITKKYKLLSKDTKYRTKNMELWANSQNLPEELKFSPDDINLLKTDPPLFLYILLEASLPKEKGGGNGEHLGVLGSIIVAETFYKALLTTEEMITPPDGSDIHQHAEEMLEAQVPQSMSDLIGTVKPWNVNGECPDIQRQRNLFS